MFADPFWKGVYSKAKNLLHMEQSFPFREDPIQNGLRVQESKSLRKRAYSDIMKISPSKNWKLSDKNSDIFSFPLKT